ncbi:MAG: sodium-dependent transporter, partial [Bacteroidia bacterium]|nr:sodium-dependent transporter [Bacteroidia bacterium]
WGSKLGIILAMAGSAVGLGNFLRFPIQAIQNGGGAFLIPYLLCFLLLGIPLLWAEWAMGRSAGQKGFHSPPFILQSFSSNPIWKYIGALGIFINLAVAGYYCYIESWTLSYAIFSFVGAFHQKSLAEIQAYFDHYVGNPLGLPLIYFLVCVAINTWILSRGLQTGIEWLVKIGMPILLFLGILLAIRGVTLQTGELGASYDGTVGLSFLWTPKFQSLLQPQVWLAAAGQIFFTLALGMGSIHCYASYLNRTDDIALSAMYAGWMNEIVEVLIGSSILIPIAISYLGIDHVVELTKNGGFGLCFRVLPFLFNQWGTIGGSIAGMMWFGMLFFAGITSSLAMGQPWISFLEDHFQLSKTKAAYSFGLLSIILGLPTIFYFSEGMLDDFDYWAGTVALVIFAFAETILFAWIYGIENAWQEIELGAEITVPRIFKWILKYVTPLLLIFVMFGSFFAPANGDWFSAFNGFFTGQGWTLDDRSLWGQITLSSLQKQEANKPEIHSQIQILQTGRLLLIILLCGILYLIYLANRRLNQSNVINKAKN